MPKFTPVVNKNNQYTHEAYKGTSEPFELDLSVIAEEYADIESVTWAVKYGNASVSDESLTSNTATAQITMNDEGKSLIEVTANTDNDVFVYPIRVTVQDTEQVNDYGVCYG